MSCGWGHCPPMSVFWLTRTLNYSSTSGQLMRMMVAMDTVASLPAAVPIVHSFCPGFVI